MLSRVANSVYWMNRYLERANNVARFIDVNLRMVLDMNFTHNETQWEPLVLASGDKDLFFNNYQACNEDTVIDFLTFNLENPNSIISCIQMARENARNVREIISSEFWENINKFYHFVRNKKHKHKLDDMQSFYKLVINYGNLLNGIWADTISHGEFWHFAHLGQMLERADKTARILDVKYFILLPNIELINSPIDSLEWSAVLKSVSAFEMYRKQFHRITYQNVARFLIFDPNFPRAMKFCINEAKESLYSIYEILDLETKIQNELAKMLDLFTVNNIDNIVMHGLHKFIDDFQINLNNLDEYIYQTFFTLKTA